MDFFTFTLFLGLTLCELPPPYPPGLEDLNEFPGYEAAQQNRLLAGNHVTWLEGQLSIDPTNLRLSLWLGEARELRCVWDALEDAQNNESWHSEQHRLDRLEDLRWLLGDDYFLRRMPFPLPIHRFSEIR